MGPSYGICNPTGGTMSFDFAGLTVLFGILAVVGSLIVIKYQTEAASKDDDHGH